MTKPVKTGRIAVTSGKHSIAFDVAGDPTGMRVKLGNSQEPDGKWGFNLWPSIEEAAPYGDINVVPVPYEMSHLIGRVIIQNSAVETRVKSLLSQLCTFNGTTLDWQKISKFGTMLTRLQTDLTLIESKAPIGAKLLHAAAERTRPLHRSRGNLTHGELTFVASERGMEIVAVSKHGEERFTEAALRDLALRLCRVWFELKAALDPESHNALRALPEKQFLQGFQASSPLPPPKQPKPPHPPRSSRA